MKLLHYETAEQPTDDLHQVRNTGPEPWKFLCLVPNSATAKLVTEVPECGADLE